MSDIIHHYEVADFNIGDHVYGYDYSNIRREGHILKIDLEDKNRNRFYIKELGINFHSFLKIVHLVSDEKKS